MNGDRRRTVDQHLLARLPELRMWIFEPIRKYAEFTGRSRRREYWGFLLAIVLLSVPAALIDVFAFQTSPEGFEAASSESFDAGFGPAMMVLMIGLVVPLLALHVRRLHDMDYSGWWVLLEFIPGVNILMALLLGVVPGTAGPNRFGPAVAPMVPSAAV